MKYKILFLCDFNKKSANTIIDHATSFKKYSRHDLFYYNPFCKSKPDWLSLVNFDVIVIHYSIYTLGESHINESWRRSIAESPAVKVMFIQDEYRTVHAIHERMRQLGINILFTCYPEDQIEKVYPAGKLPLVKIKVNNLTGYVPSYLKKKRPDFNKKRNIDVGYRARGLGFWWLGELYQEKSRIGELFVRHVQTAGIKFDISSREEDRIYGKKWIQFLEDCRCTLGTESGASVVDFTGEIEENVKAYCRDHPDASFENVREIFFKDVEGTINMNQISPRVFEAIGCGCCLILYQGNYSGVLTPGIHYIELNKDFSNISDVLNKIADNVLVRNIAQRAYEDVIAAETYSYRTFVGLFDNTIERYISEWGINCVNIFKETPVSSPGIINDPESIPEPDIMIDNNTNTKRPLVRHILFHIWFLFLKIILRIKIILISHFYWRAVKIYWWAKNLYWRLKRLCIVHPFFFKEKIRLLKINILQ